jgi:hypothetical protein
MDTLAIELSLRDALPAAARGDHAAYGRVVAMCQNAITGIALAITRDVQASLAWPRWERSSASVRCGSAYASR